MKEKPAKFLSGELVTIYDDKDAEGHMHYKRIGVVIGTVEPAPPYKQFYTYKIFLGNKVAKIHEVWIKKLRTKKEQYEAV